MAWLCLRAYVYNCSYCSQKLGRRVQRITTARQGQLQDLRRYVFDNNLEATLDAIVLVDVDMAALPGVSGVRLTVDAVGAAGPWDAVCSNGIGEGVGNGGTNFYYDTFATVISSQTFVTLPAPRDFQVLSSFLFVCGLLECKSNGGVPNVQLQRLNE